jgi:ionotropic glutamate receptor
MYVSLQTLIFLVWFSIYIRCSPTPNPLNGKHLRAIWVNDVSNFLLCWKELHIITIFIWHLIYLQIKTRWKGNPKGLSGPLKGGAILETLSARFNFT